jgi:hypothetical protein
LIDDPDTDVSVIGTTSSGREWPLGDMEWDSKGKFYYMTFKLSPRPRRVHLEATAKIKGRIVATGEIDLLG